MREMLPFLDKLRILFLMTLMRGGCSVASGIAAAAAAKSRQSCPTLCDPIDSSPQARTVEWVAISFSNA